MGIYHLCAGKMKRPSVQRLIAVVWFAAVAPGGAAHAQCPVAAKTGFPAQTVAGSGSAPANDTFFGLSHSRAFLAQGNALFCILNVAEGGNPGGSKCPGWPGGGWTDVATLSNFPSPVVLTKDANSMNGAEYIFLGSQDGNLYKIDASNGVGVATVSTRRKSCNQDQVIATPAVQLYRFANAVFQSEMNRHGKAGVDLVLVGTHTMCGDSTHNSIIAYYSDDLTVKWQFNQNGAKKVDYISDGGSIDYANNRYYFGTNLNSGVSQNSLWAISTLDGYDGAGGQSPVWAGNAGPIRNRPQLAYGTSMFPAGRVLVATYSGAIQAYDPNGDGNGNMSPLWATPGQMPGQVIRDVWYESRAGLFQNHFLVVDTIGNLRAYADTGSAAAVLWTQVANNGSRFTSMPAVFPSQNVAYIGKMDGRLLQVDLAHGGWGADGAVTGGAQTVGDPTVDVQSGGSDIDTVTATAANGVITALTVPWSAAPCSPGGIACNCPGAPNAPASCASAACSTQGPCITIDCVGVAAATGTGQCATSGKWAPSGPASAGGTDCDDGDPLTCDCSHANPDGTCPAGANLDACESGACQSNCYSNRACTNVGDRACGSGKPSTPNATCCGSAGCVNLDTDPTNCGACGHGCASGTCAGGTCRGQARCGFPGDSMLNNTSASLTGADAIVYDNTLLADGGGTCNALLSSYRTTTDSPIYRVSPSSVVTPMHNGAGAGDHTPLHGIAVASQGNQVFGGLVNDYPQASYSPELAISIVPANYSRSGVTPAPAKTSSNQDPFAVNSYNAGPVGPVFDYLSYDGVTNTKRTVYYANYQANGDLFALTYSGGAWSAAPLQNGGASIRFPGRVTAIAFGKHHSSDGTNNHRQLAVATKETLKGAPHVVIRIVDLDGGNANHDCDGTNVTNCCDSSDMANCPQAHCPNDCVDLSLWTPPMGDAETAPTRVLSLAMHNAFGDIYAEVEDAQNNVFILNVDPYDLSLRRQRDVCDDQNISPHNFPIVIGRGVGFEGRLAITPDLNLMYLIPYDVDGTPAFKTYTVSRPGPARPGPNIKTVFIILMENNKWSNIKGNPSAPYINNTLLPIASHAEQYFNPPNMHPSEPNYLWLEAGSNFGIVDDAPPAQNHQNTAAHLTTMMKNANVSWRTYQESITGTVCPLNSAYPYAPKHDPFVYFDDATGTNNPNDPYCIEHNRPFSEFARDLNNNAVARYNFITPNLCNDMHDSCSPINDAVKQGDTWLSVVVPEIMASPAYKNGGALFVTWDESEGGDFPVGMIVVSNLAKGQGYSNMIHYTHGSTLRTMQEIFGVSQPFLGDAANQVDLSDLFTVFP